MPSRSLRVLRSFVPPDFFLRVPRANSFYTPAPGFMPGIHVFLVASRYRKTWMAGTSPATESMGSSSPRRHEGHGKEKFLRPGESRDPRFRGSCGGSVGPGFRRDDGS